MGRYTQLIRSIPRLVLYSVRSDHAKLDREIFNLFSSMGGLYVKFLQILVSNAGALKTLSYQQRMSVFAESRPSPLQHREVLRRELGDEALSQLATLEDSPFSTGSFANVYRGQLKSGEVVVVKIKRPGLEKQLKKDLRVIRTVAWIIDQFDSNDRYNIRNIGREYSAGIELEVDYESEVANAQEIYNSYQHQNQIVIAKTFADLCTRDIIVQEFLDGVLLSDVLKRPSEEVRQYVKQHLGSDLDKQMHVLGGDFLDRSFSSLPIHGDPHPGNVILLPNNKVGLIDFGLIAQPASDMLGYVEYMYEQSHINHGKIRAGKFGVALLRTHSAGLYQALAILDRAAPNSYLLKQMEQAMERRYNDNAQNIPGLIHKMQGGYTNQIFDSVVNPGNSLSLSFDMDGMLMLRANNIIWSSMIQLGIYRDVVPAIVDKSVQRARSGTQLINSRYRGKPRDLEEAMEFIGQWLLSVRESDPVFFMAVKNLFPSRLWEA